MSMKWFRTLWLTSEERCLLREAKEKQNLPSVSTTESSTLPIEHIDRYLSKPVLPTKAYKNILYADGHITVIFPNGDVVCKTGVDSVLFQQVKDAKSQEDIEKLLVDKIYVPEKEEEEQWESEKERKLVSDNLEVLRCHPDFKVEGNQVILKGVNLSIPASVVASFIEVCEKLEYAERRFDRSGIKECEDNYEALKMFWLKLALNTLPQSREDLILFIRENDVKITRNGNLILYRRIVSKKGADNKMVSYVTNEYYRIKKEGNDPRTFAVGKDGNDYYTVDLQCNSNLDPKTLLGNLQVLYLELPTMNSNTYTAYHDNKVEIKIGGIYRIPDSKINLDNRICAAGGLHAAAVDYNYSGFGDVPVVVLVNPSKAITVPLGETGKLRTVEMFVACINNKPQGVHFDDGSLAAFDTEYHDLTLDELENVAKTKCFDSLAVRDTVPAVSLTDLTAIKNMLANRVQLI